MTMKDQYGLVAAPINVEIDLPKSGSNLSAGKYLAFQMSDEEYAVDILKVQEIIGVMNITHVPKMPSYVRGIINLRGSVIPVVDLRLKFDLEYNEYTERTCIIVIQVKSTFEHTVMGIIVDQVSEVIDFNLDQLEQPPDFGSGIHADYILGMGKLEKRVIILLDIERLLSSLERELI